MSGINLNMTVTEMLQFHDLLEKKLERTTASKQRLFIEQQIELVFGMLSGALFMTASVAMPQINRTLSAAKIDKELLSIVIGENRMLAFSNIVDKQTDIQFELVREIEEPCYETELKKRIYPLVSRNFVKNIPNAVDLYRELTNSKLPVSKCWIEIKKMFPDNLHFSFWGKHLSSTIVEDGPIKTFIEVKKNLSGWSDMDIAIIIQDAIDSYTSSASKEKVEAIMDDIKHKYTVKEYLFGDKNVELLKELEGISDTTVTGRRIAQIFSVINPERRNDLLKRKEYVESGYC